MADTIRTLHLVNTLPYPPYSGYNQRVLQIMQNLSGRVQQTILCRIMTPLTPEQDAFCEEAPFDIHTVLLPRPNLLQKIVKGLRFLPAKYPVTAAGWYFKPMVRTLRKLLAEESFDFIVLEGIWLSVYWPIIRHSPAQKVLNLYDLESELLRRHAEVLPPGLNRWIYLSSARRMENLEKELSHEADLIWTVSEKERGHLLNPDTDLPVYLAPNGVDCSAIEPLPPQNGKEILFVGSFQYYPNVDGVQFFVNQVMPEVLKRCPQAVFRMVGRQPDKRIKALHKPPSIILTGEVDELEPCYRNAQVCVVPLRSGGGTRLKILEAMAYGRPVVSTTVGAEGIDVEHNRNILIADQPAEIAEAVCRVLNGPNLARNLTEEGRRLVESRYAWKSIANGMYEQYRTLMNKKVVS